VRKVSTGMFIGRLLAEMLFAYPGAFLISH